MMPGERRSVKKQSASEPMVKATIYALSVFCCSFHLVLTSIGYFKYSTEAYFATYIPFEQELPFFTLCLAVDHNSTTGIIDESCEARPLASSAVIENCALRNFTSRRVEHIDCALGFHVTQSTLASIYNCYTVRAVKRTKFNILEAIAVSKDSRKMYKFKLYQQLEEHTEMMLIMMHLTSNAYREYRYSQETRLSKGKKSVSILTAYKTFESYALPAPYDTNCVEESLCFDSCGRRHSWCNNTICSQNVTITYISQLKEQGEGMFFEVATVASPSTKIEYIAKQPFNAFILKVCSLLGVWLSLSVHLIASSAMAWFTKKNTSFRDINPVDLKRKVLHLWNKAGVSSFNPNSVRQKCGGKREGKKCGRLIKPIAKFSVILLFIRELALISRDYFQYKSLFDVEMVIDKMKEYPSISYCLEINEWFNRTAPVPRYESYDREITKFDEAFRPTLKQLFESTPRETSVIKKCRIRESVSSDLMTLIDCNQHFRVTKFYFGEFICYQMRPAFKLVPLSEIEATSSIIYSVILSDEIARVVHYQAIVSDSLPDVSRFLVSESWKQSKNEKVKLGYQLVEYTLLSYPFELACKKYDDVSITECLADCWNFTRWSRVPFSIITDRPVGFPVVNYVDMKNETFADAYVIAEQHCDKICSIPCKDSFSSTFHEIESLNDSLELALSYPKYPVYQLIAIPLHTMDEYIFQLFCSASFWIGASLVNSLLIIASLRVRKRALQDGGMSLNKMVERLQQKIKIKFKRPGVKKCTTKIRWRRKMKSLTYPLILAIGFCIHCFIATAEYFDYPTIMNTKVAFEENFKDLRPRVCVSLDQFDLGKDYTLSDIWTKSPRTDELMVECGYRGANVPSLSHLPRALRRRTFPFINSTSLCYSLLKVKKFVSLALVCYEIKPVESMVDTEYRVRRQISSPRIFGYVILSPAVARYNLTVSVTQGPAGTSLIMPVPLLGTEPTALSKYYFIRYMKFYISSLPYPYQMGVYDSLKRIKCMRDCVNRAMEEKHLFSSYGSAVAPSDLRYETGLETSLGYSATVRRECEEECRTSKRDQKAIDVYFDSFSDGPFNTINFPHLNGTTSLWFCTSNQVVTATSFLPRLRFVDLVLYAGSIFAIWFGVSAFHLIDLISNGLHIDKRDDDRAMHRKLHQIDKQIHKQYGDSCVHSQPRLNQWSYISSRKHLKTQQVLNTFSKVRT